MNARKIIIIIAGLLMLAIMINFMSGTTIVINGKQVTGIAGYIAAYLGLVLLAALLVIIIPSTLILGALLLVVFGIFFILFIPILPIAFLLLPGVIFMGIVYFIYRIAKKGKK